jgi:hypothetical protein
LNPPKNGKTREGAISDGALAASGEFSIPGSGLRGR